MTTNVSNGGQAQRSTFRHSFMMNSSYNHPSQDDMADGLDPIDCDFIFECLGQVHSEMAGGGFLPPMPTLPPTVNNNNGRSARSPTKKSTRISSSPKEKSSSASPRASRPKSSSMAGSSTEETPSAPSSTMYDEDEQSMDDGENDKKLSLKDMKNNQLEASKDRRRYVLLFTSHLLFSSSLVLPTLPFIIGNVTRF